MVHRLFVYGTLAPGQPNQHLLAEVPGTWSEATVRGRLVDYGWGSALGFPALELGGEDRIAGLVLSAEGLPEHWERLDEFEGDGYTRVLVTARLEDGDEVEAFVYAARRPPPG